MNEFWVIEYNGVPQLGHSEQYYAIEQAEENFGAILDGNGEPYKLLRYVPSGEPPIDPKPILEQP